MSIAIKLDEALVSAAKVHAESSFRSTPKQIEYWAMLGRMAEQNPDLTHEFLVGLLQARAEAAAGDVTEYRFG